MAANAKQSSDYSKIKGWFFTFVGFPIPALFLFSHFSSDFDTAKSWIGIIYGFEGLFATGVFVFFIWLPLLCCIFYPIAMRFHRKSQYQLRYEAEKRGYYKGQMYDSVS